MIFALHPFRREFRKRRLTWPSASDESCAQDVNEWANENPDADVHAALAEFEKRHKSGSLLVTLAVLLLVIQIVYYLRSMPHGGEELGDDDE